MQTTLSFQLPPLKTFRPTQARKSSKTIHSKTEAEVLPNERRYTPTSAIMNFTFLTMTDTPSLGESMSKRMRAQVTKHNFAQRRQRRARAIAGIRHNQSSKLNSNNIEKLETIATNPSPPSCPIQFLLSNFRPLLFPSIPDSPDSLHDTAWTSLLVSEPAFLEATLCLAQRYKLRQLRPAANGLPPDIHTYRAIKLINQRLKDPPTALSDGVLGAVFTLAFNERLSGNERAWNVHVEGLAQMMKFRRDQGQTHAPRWFFNLLLCDAVNELIRSPSASRRVIASVVLDDNTSHQLSRISEVSEAVLSLRGLLEVSRYSGIGNDILDEEIDKSIKLLLEQTSVLRGQEPFISAFSLAIMIFLHLSWPRSSLTPADLGHLATLLRRELGVPDIRLCSSLNLATWLLMVGYIAALDAQTKGWFMGTLKMVVSVLQINSWAEVLEMLRATFLPDSCLIHHFKDTWDKIKSVSVVA